MKKTEELNLVARFEDLSLPASQWTHEAHLCVAFHYIQQFGFEKAVEKLRQGIQRYNESLGKNGSYHETITLAMARLLSLRMKIIPKPSSFAALKAKYPGMFLWNSSPLLAHYSRPRLYSQQARDTFLEPDLAPFEEDGRQ